MTLNRNILNMQLLDDNTKHGGVSFHGETVADFIAETNIKPKSIEKLNKELKTCGIKPIIERV